MPRSKLRIEGCFKTSFMGLLTVNCLWKTKAGNLSAAYLPFGKTFGDHYDVQNWIPAKKRVRLGANTRAFASKKSVKKSRKYEEVQKIVTPRPNKRPLDEYDGSADKSPSRDDRAQDNSKISSFDNLDLQSTSITIPSRSSVLRACTVTSGLIAALGVVLRQVSHVVSAEGWATVADCSTEISFNFEMWHLELIIGLVILISSCRYLLLKIWPDFSESSEAANQQVLTSLQPLDYVVVAFLPGVSEELLFRGAMLPLFGINWKSALVVSVIFGLLHFGSGRKYSFAVWATCVGLAYSYATILSSSIIVPMASHALNNLVGGIIWRYTSDSSK